jgi:hypothetical protein
MIDSLFSIGMLIAGVYYLWNDNIQFGLFFILFSVIISAGIGIKCEINRAKREIIKEIMFWGKDKR